LTTNEEFPFCACGCGKKVETSRQKFLRGHGLKLKWKKLKENNVTNINKGCVDVVPVELPVYESEGPEDPDDLSYWFNEELFFRDKAGNLKSKNNMKIVKTKQELKEIEDQYYGEVASNAEALKRSLESQFGKRGELLAKELKKMITNMKTPSQSKLAAIKLAAEYFTGGLEGNMTIKIEKKVANFYKMISE